MQTEKKKYSKPQLKVHGTIEQLTKAAMDIGVGDSFHDAENSLNDSPTTFAP